MKKLKSALILLSIAGVVTTLTVVVGNTLTTNFEKELALKTNNTILKTPTPSPIPTPTPIPKRTPLPSPTPVATPEATQTPTPAPTPTPVSVILPAAGAEVVGEYSEEAFVFQPTYGDYRTHLGMDFANDKNTPVCSVADGIVTQNYFDYEHGYTVEIEHADELTSIYKNLAGDKMVQVGQVVKQGDVIGSMGDTGISEKHLSHHLHFELLKSNEPVNPREYFEASIPK